MTLGLVARLPLRFILGTCALFSGAALLSVILFDTSLPLNLAVIGGGVGTLTAIAMARADLQERSRLRRVAAAGAIAGLIATLAYDSTKFVLSQADPSPYNPFVATHVFGVLLVGSGASPVAIEGTGLAFHMLNGTAFGVAFALLFGADGSLSPRSALVRGVGWGLFLESFQIALYPGWLDIRAFQEFATISVAAHVVYGAVLGLLGRALLRRWVFDPYAI